MAARDRIVNPYSIAYDEDDGKSKELHLPLTPHQR